jgi:hypothetical protein
MLAQGYTFGRVTSGQYFTLTPVIASADTIIRQLCRTDTQNLTTSQPETVYPAGVFGSVDRFKKVIRLCHIVKAFLPPRLKPGVSESFER